MTAAAPALPHPASGPRGILRWLTTTDHKVIGLSYLVTSFVFFGLAGLLALGIRAELAAPELQFLSEERFNQFFTMHGTVMLFFFATPFAFGLANYLVPLHVGAPDMAFPRLNALSYWLFLGGGLILFAGFLTPRGAADFGWFAYSPLNDSVHAPHIGADLWIAGLMLSGVSGVIGAVNFVATIVALRAPGMTMFRMPIFTWNMLVVSVMVLIAFPVLTAALLLLYADRRFDAQIFTVANNGPLLWQHMFWFFGHPEVYIIALPFFGVVSEVLPVFSRKPIFGYKGLVFATLLIAVYSVAVWAHHMFATGAVLLPYFALLSFLIAVPTGVKFFNWIGTMWRGQISFETPMLFAVGFLVTFLVGGLSGVLLASPPVDFHVTDTYFVVAHMHYVLFGSAVFAAFAAIYFWFPKWTGRRLHEGWGRLHFLLVFVGFNLTFLVQHVLGLDGMPRRVADYDADTGWTTLNALSTAGAMLTGTAMLVFLWNVWSSLRTGRPAPEPDPWGWGNSLEWATSSPPPRANFDRLPPIRSIRPAFDLHHPDVPRASGHGRRKRTDEPS